jgi:hypothetical protein
MKVKVKFFLCLINYAPNHEDIWGNGSIIPSFLTYVLDGGAWLVSRLGNFIVVEIVTDFIWIGGWVAARVGLDAVEKRKILAPATRPSLYPLSSSDSILKAVFLCLIKHLRRRPC